MKPIVVINFKLYPESSGKNALILAQKIASVRAPKHAIILAPTLLTTREISKTTKLPIFAQHIDPITFGAHTGHIGMNELKESKITGVLLNHSERKVALPTLQKTILLCKKNKLQTIVCASSIAEIKLIAPLRPTFIAYEPAELIGKDISVTQAKPQIITKAQSLLQQPTKLLVGAGIHSSDDIHHALSLGAQGVLLSHAICTAKNPQKALQGLLQ
jgi:triosephosphate isomerase